MHGTENEPEKLGVLWKRKSKRGTDYWSGNINGQQIVVFAVRQKRSPKSPDFEIYKSERRDKQTAFHSEEQDPW
jgi:hypothetical protein